MTSINTTRWPWIVPILIYAAATLEMIIMVSPFAAYFYSVYTPLLHGLEASAATAWLLYAVAGESGIAIAELLGNGRPSAELISARG